MILKLEPNKIPSNEHIFAHVWMKKNCPQLNRDAAERLKKQKDEELLKAKRKTKGSDNRGSDNEGSDNEDSDNQGSDDGTDNQESDDSSFSVSGSEGSLADLVNKSRKKSHDKKFFDEEFHISSSGSKKLHFKQSPKSGLTFKKIPK